MRARLSSSADSISPGQAFPVELLGGDPRGIVGVAGGARQRHLQCPGFDEQGVGLAHQADAVVAGVAPVAGGGAAVLVHRLGRRLAAHLIEPGFEELTHGPLRGWRGRGVDLGEKGPGRALEVRIPVFPGDSVQPDSS